jgi:homocysteine S-methyltransferase
MLSQLIAQQGFVVLDGGLATQLEVQGANLNDPLWSGKILIESPEMLEKVNYDYLCAGADIATTGSYQATIPGLMSKGLTAPQAEAVIRQSVDISRRARDRFWSEPANRINRFKPLVAASIGPYGAYLHDGSEYVGNYGLTHDQLKDFHRARLAILVESQPDIIAFESFPSQNEAAAIVELLEEFPETTCWISFTCKDGIHISEGTTFAEAVRLVSRSSQVLAVGVNCVPPSNVESLLRSARHETDKPLAAYPNNGAGFDAVSSKWDDRNELALIKASVSRWSDAGARLIGGCCNTTPDTVREIRIALEELKQPV